MWNESERACYIWYNGNISLHSHSVCWQGLGSPIYVPWVPKRFHFRQECWLSEGSCSDAEICLGDDAVSCSLRLPLMILGWTLRECFSATAAAYIGTRGIMSSIFCPWFWLSVGFFNCSSVDNIFAPTSHVQLPFLSCSLSDAARNIIWCKVADTGGGKRINCLP